MELTLVMTFITEHGLKSNLSISGFKYDLTKDQINALMDTIISKNIFAVNFGAFIRKDSAQVTDRKVIKFDLN